jgi:hypothetical protein
LDKKSAKTDTAKVVKPANVLQADLHPHARSPLIQFRRRNLGALATWSTLDDTQISPPNIIGPAPESPKSGQILPYRFEFCQIDVNLLSTFI